MGYWRKSGAAASCVADLDDGPGTCGHEAQWRGGPRCTCSAEDLACSLRCADEAHWARPAPPQEGRDCEAKCAGGLARACYKMALVDDNSPVARKRRESLSYLDRACSLGHVRACDRLAFAYRSDADARALPSAYGAFRWRCEHLDTRGLYPDACARVAEMSENGWGTAVDRARARDAYGRDCAARRYPCDASGRCPDDPPSCNEARRLGAIVPPR